MFSKLMGFINLFRKGKEITNVEFWKKTQAYGQPIIAGLIVSVVQIAKGYGYVIPINDETALALGGVIYVVVNFVLTYATTAKIGLLPAKEPVPIEDHSFQSILPDVQSNSPESQGMRSMGESEPIENVQFNPEAESEDVLAGLDTTYVG